MTKDQMLAAGRTLLERWCAANKVTVPTVTVTQDPTMFGTWSSPSLPIDTEPLT